MLGSVSVVIDIFDHNYERNFKEYNESRRKDPTL